MTALLLIVTAIICYALGNVSGCMILSRFFFKKHKAKYARMEASVLDFYEDFGILGVVLLALFGIAKALLATLIGGALLGFVEASAVGRLFGTFCLLLGHSRPFLFLFKGGKSVLCAGVAAFVIDWRVGLCCWVLYVVVIIFTRYAALGSVAAAVFAPIFMWIFGLDGLQGTLALLCALVIVCNYAENLVRLIGGTEPKCFDFVKRASNREEIEDEIDE